MGNDKNSRFGLGLVIGSVVAGAAALLLSPRSGKENRDILNKKMAEWKKMMESGELEKKVKKIFGDVSDESVRIYATARERVMEGIETMKNMDGDDYAKMVQNIMDDVKSQAKVSADKLKSLQESFIKDWPNLKEDVEKHRKKIARSAKAREAAKSNGQAKKAS